VQELAMKIEQ